MVLAGLETGQDPAASISSHSGPDGRALVAGSWARDRCAFRIKSRAPSQAVAIRSDSIYTDVLWTLKEQEQTAVCSGV